MILTPHIIFGAAVGSNFQNPLIAFLASMISHYFLDSFKHWDYSFDNLKNYLNLLRVKAENKENANFNLAAKDFFKIAFDFSLGFLILIYFLNQDPQLFKILLSGFFGALPDGFQILHFVFPKIFLKHQEFHDFMHFPKLNLPVPRTGKLQFPSGVLNQIIIILIAIFLFKL